MEQKEVKALHVDPDYFMTFFLLVTHGAQEPRGALEPSGTELEGKFGIKSTQ